MDWVIGKMKAGYVDVTNPFNRNQTYRVSLKPEHVKCWVWWSKNFYNWIKTYKTDSSLFNLYKGHSFQFTINSPSELETNITISLEERFNQLEWLLKNFGALSVNFRFDPIIFYRRKGSESLRDNLDKFEYIVERISSLGLNEMIFSFATIYSKVKYRMISRGFIPIDLPLNEKKNILIKLIPFCQKYKIKMKACCQPDLISISGIEQAHCIDAYKIERIVGESIPKMRDSGQRKSCGCYKSKDIGGYTGIFRCRHNCHYCYASPAKR